MRRIQFIRFWSIAVGGMDAFTGALLLATPSRVLELLQIPPVGDEASLFLRWIGIFVMGVGLSYFFGLGRKGQGEAIWYATALIRTMVAVFLTTAILTDQMPMPWLLVAITDASVAIIQISISRLGWWADFRHLSRNLSPKRRA